ncbi:MAG: hypothetical protein ABI175_12530 [Polyangiales bacterium]
MRLLAFPILAALTAPAAAQPLWEAELRIGYGVAMGKATDMATAHRTTPLTLEATGAIAIANEPEVSTYGGILVETVRENTFGFVGGIKLRVPEMPVRLSAGAIFAYAPATKWGVSASGGMCKDRGALALCADLQLTNYFAGDAIDPGHTITEVQLVLGIGFDLSHGSK